MRLLIDGDILCFRAGFACEKTKYLLIPENLELGFTEYEDSKTATAAQKGLGGQVWSRKELEPEDKALMLVDIMIEDIRSRYAAENPTTLLFLSGSTNYRHRIASRAPYKGNRSSSVPPTHLRSIRAHLVEKHKATVSEGEEADDLLGIAMTAYPDSILCSIDKDLMQLPGRHYNFVTKEEVTVTPKEAAINFYSQVLSGDATDNVPGLTGIGPVKARKALENCSSPLQCWQKCVSMYEAEFGKKGLDYAVEAAQLVYVRRKPGEIWDYGNETKKGAKAA
jgi:hypothetical protein